MILHDEKGNPISEFPQDGEGNRALPVLLTHLGEHINLDAQNIAATTPFILISLRDTGKWKHTNTNTIHIDWLGVNINPAAAYRGDISIGFISNSKASSANFNILKTWHFDQAANGVQAFLPFTGSHMECNEEHWFGPSVANDTSFGNNVALIGPDGYNHFGVYNGDLVLKIGRTAGNVDVGIAVGYHTT